MRTFITEHQKANTLLCFNRMHINANELEPKILNLCLVLIKSHRFFVIRQYKVNTFLRFEKMSFSV